MYDRVYPDIININFFPLSVCVWISLTVGMHTSHAPLHLNSNHYTCYTLHCIFFFILYSMVHSILTYFGHVIFIIEVSVNSYILCILCTLWCTSFSCWTLCMSWIVPLHCLKHCFACYVLHFIQHLSSKGWVMLGYLCSPA